jgi:hypothetical protein
MSKSRQIVANIEAETRDVKKGGPNCRRRSKPAAAFWAGFQ